MKRTILNEIRKQRTSLLLHNRYHLMISKRNDHY